MRDSDKRKGRVFLLTLLLSIFICVLSFVAYFLFSGQLPAVQEPAAAQTVQTVLAGHAPQAGVHLPPVERDHPGLVPQLLPLLQKDGQQRRRHKARQQGARILQDDVGLHQDPAGIRRRGAKTPRLGGMFDIDASDAGLTGPRERSSRRIVPAFPR